MTEYVAGFLFNETRTCVALIEKQRPDWQKGKWNAIGGHIEPTDLSPLDAMQREFKEETGVSITDWQQFCTLSGNDWKVYFYRAFSNEICNVVMTTDEYVDLHVLKFLPRKLMTNIRWLIDMALSMDDERTSSFEVKEAA